MASFLLCKKGLERALAQIPSEAIPSLEESDFRDDYTGSDGDGIWIRDYVGFLERVVRERCALPEFSFVEDDHLDEDLFEEVPSLHVRALLIEFTNEVYPDWKEDGVDLPDYDEVRIDSRTYCDDCEHAYEEVYGTYDGALPEDVEEDEDLQDPDLTDEERRARGVRNTERAAERTRRQEAKEEAEAEVVDQEWVCSQDCDGFLNYVDEQFREGINVDVDKLEDNWDEFLKVRGEYDFPPLIVELARSKLP